MKKLFICFLISYLLISVYGQFQHSYGTKENEIGQSVRSTYFDNGYIIGGYSDYGFLSNDDATLVKTNEQGDIKWAKIYGGRLDEMFNSTRPINLKEDRGYVSLGYTNSYGNGEYDFFFVRTDKEGNPLIFKTYGGEKYENGHCLQVIKDIETGQEGIIMIGESNSFYNNSNSLKMFVVKTDLDGNIVRSAIVGNLANHYGFWIEQTKDGGFIAVGMSSFTCGSNGSTSYYDIFVAKLKPDLQLEWARTIGGGADLPYTDYATSVKETEDGFILTGKTKSFGYNNSYDAYLLKLSKKGDFKWLNTYGNIYSGGGSDILNEEYAGLHHQYLLVGSISLRGSTYAHLIGTDNNGNLRWNRGYGLEGVQGGHELDRNTRLGYSFVGYEETFGVGERNIYHVVTDSSGYSYCPLCEIEPKIVVAKHEPCIREGGYSIPAGETKKYDPRAVDGFYRTVKCGESVKNINSNTTRNDINWDSDNDFTVFPNPVADLIEVRYPNNFQNGRWLIFNNIGQLVLCGNLSEQKALSISLDKLTSGFYTLNLINKNGELMSKKIIKTNNP